MDLGHDNRRDRLDALAAEYALGVLAPRARRRLARAARRDARVADAIERWELRLSALAVAVPPVTPPPRVWNQVASRLGLSGPGEAAAPWWSRWQLWRGFAVVATLAAVTLGIALVAGRMQPAGPSVVVILAGQDARPALVATVSADGRELAVKAVGPLNVSADRALELWALPEGGAPRSLGLVPPSGSGRLRLPAAALERIPALAISLEPAGGSPTGAPTGPVLYTGRIERI